VTLCSREERAHRQKLVGRASTAIRRGRPQPVQRIRLAAVRSER
jgi:hypothetical protein